MRLKYTGEGINMLSEAESKRGTTMQNTQSTYLREKEIRGT